VLTDQVATYFPILVQDTKAFFRAWYAALSEDG
jgi:hypothetical protein